LIQATPQPKRELPILMIPPSSVLLQNQVSVIKRRITLTELLRNLLIVRLPTQLSVVLNQPKKASMRLLKL